MIDRSVVGSSRVFGSSVTGLLICPQHHFAAISSIIVIFSPSFLSFASVSFLPELLLHIIQLAWPETLTQNGHTHKDHIRNLPYAFQFNTQMLPWILFFFCIVIVELCTWSHYSSSLDFSGTFFWKGYYKSLVIQCFFFCKVTFQSILHSLTQIISFPTPQCRLPSVWLFRWPSHHPPWR